MISKILYVQSVSPYTTTKYNQKALGKEGMQCRNLKQCNMLYISEHFNISIDFECTMTGSFKVGIISCCK